MSRENLELARSIFARWERGDYETTDWAAPEIDFSSPGGLSDEVFHGLDAMERAWADWLGQFEEFSAEATDYLESGDQVVVLNRFGGRGKGSGVPMDEQGATRFRFRDGKVVELAIYVDPRRALRDAGLER